MRWSTLGLFAPAVIPIICIPPPVGAAVPEVYEDVLVRRSPEWSPSEYSRSLLSKYDDHEHMSHGAPLEHFDDSEFLKYHPPTPPSYWTIDIEDSDPNATRYPGLMALHGVLMCLAFFVALPAGIAMRSVNHAWHGVAVLSFYGFCILGCAASALYSKLTPNMYEGSGHSAQGYIVLLLSLVLSAVDIIAFFVRLYTFIRSGEKFAFKFFWRTVVLNRDDEQVGSNSEYAGLTNDEPDEIDLEAKTSRVASTDEPSHDADEQFTDETVSWRVHNANRHHYTRSVSSEQTLYGSRSPQGSRHSDETLHDIGFPQSLVPKKPLARRIAKGAFATLERVLVFAGFGMLLSGIAVYTGGCRGSFINICLAHLIKGGIFWCYGVVSFARFLGSFSEFGWAWNRAPSGNYPTAEFTESFVIFLYGISNTWMERFGVAPGSPYTTKQIQHISIAVMFWFAGLIGMGVESKRVRRWLASSAANALGPAVSLRGKVSEPPSYLASFNPFPALVIGITGAAMSAHAQTYAFQMQIHMLWGYLLLGFSVLRCLTYFFLWLGPPRSILPSRPPTEALASFFLACGGLVFMMSTEELTIAAMRKGRDDVMMFLNVAVAITCFTFCWVFCIVAFKGWLKTRSRPAVSYDIAPSI